METETKTPYSSAYQRTCCSRAAAHVAQAMLLLKFVDGEAAEALISQLRPFVRQAEGLAR